MSASASATVTVCGAGIVGLACVLALTRAGIATTLIAPRRPPSAIAGDPYSPRVYAISPASRRLLDRLGVWSALPQARIAPVERMEIRGDAGGQLDLDAWQAAESHLAWIVESTEIERVLEQAVAWSGATWLDDTVAAWKPGTLTTAAGRVVTTSLAIGADGAASPLRTLAGLAHHSKPYGDVGLVAHVDCERPAQRTALQWFGSDGVLALLPLPDTARGSQVSMVWSVNAARAQDVQSLRPDAQAERLPAMLAALTSGRLGALCLNSPIFGFPLYAEHADPVAEGVALIGDAAHRVHPLAGQGLNLGLGDVEALVATVAGREPFRGPGDIQVLRRYRRARAEPVAAIRLVTDGLHRLFTTPAAPVAWMRNAGLSWVDAVPALKRVLVEQASHS